MLLPKRLEPADNIYGAVFSDISFEHGASLRFALRFL